MIFSLISATTERTGDALVNQFKTAYRLRHSDVSTGTLDPAILTDLKIIILIGTNKLQLNHDPPQTEIDSWIEPLRSVANSISEIKSTEEFGSIDLHVESHLGSHFITARMGRVTRSELLGPGNRSLNLPRQYQWNFPWDPHVTWLPSGWMMVSALGAQAVGVRIPERVSWLSASNGKVSEFLPKEFKVMSDTAPEHEIKGDLITLHSLDDPKALLRDFESKPFFQRLLTWKCTKQGPNLVLSVPQQQQLRSIDSAIYEAFHATHPTSLQQKISKLCSPSVGGLMVLTSWSVQQPSDGLCIATLNGDVRATLIKRGGYSWRMTTIERATKDHRLHLEGRN
jgi:hypothetical protein